jgi:ABC-2 type transport system ATP-binding protein
LEYGIETKGLVKIIDNKTIIDNINLKIPKGTIHGLIGSNGAGKTITLKILSGILTATTGTIRINNVNIDQTDEKYKEYIGYVPENPTLYGALKVMENLEFISSLHVKSPGMLENRIQNYVDLFNLGEIKDEYARNLSAGETQRVILAAVLIHNPEIILLDEPFYALDPHNQIILRNLLKQKRGEGKTILLATHLLNLAESICDSITLISKGKTLYEGNMSEVSRVFAGASLEDVYVNLSQNEESI